MGLDVYVGSFSRYYSGPWQTIVQRAIGADLIGSAGPSRAPAGGEPDAAAIDRWRRLVERALGGSSVIPLSWQESPVAPYFTDKLGWDAYMAVLLLAAHAARPAFGWPKALPSTLDDDPAWRPVVRDGKKTSFRHVLRPELWLPYDADTTAACANMAGHQVIVGSVHRLEAELRALNDATHKGSPSDLAAWLYAGSRARCIAAPAQSLRTGAAARSGGQGRCASATDAARLLNPPVEDHEYRLIATTMWTV